MEYTAQNIADLLNGTIVGDKDVKVSNISKIEEGNPGTLSFLANPKYTKYIYSTKASIVIVNEDFKPQKDISSTLIKVKDAYQAFAALLDFYNKNKNNYKGVDEQTYISETAKVGKNIYLGSFSYIGDNAVIGDNVKIFPQVYIGNNVRIGDNTILFPGVKVYHDCKIGANCIIHASSVIGSDGFGFAPKSQADYMKVPQIGNVILEDNVEVGSNTTIDRATIGSTIIRKGVKLDNLIQIAHNVEIGDHTVIAAQTGISGSTKLGKDCMIAGQVGFVGHLNIADEVKIAAQSGISSNIKEKGAVHQGSPNFEIRDYRKSYVLFKKLPELYKQINNLEEEIKKLREKL